jgi:hypothetical protein
MEDRGNLLCSLLSPKTEISVITVLVLASFLILLLLCSPQGVTTVYLLPGSPDPFNPIVVRCSAGASLLLEYGTEEDALQSKLPVVCADAHGGTTLYVYRSHVPHLSFITLPNS